MVRSIATTVYSWVRRAIAPVQKSAPVENNLNSALYSGYTLKIRVKKSSDAFFWYTNHIDEVFVVMATEIDRFWVREPNSFGALNFILKVDCEIVVEK